MQVQDDILELKRLVKKLVDENDLTKTGGWILLAKLSDLYNSIAFAKPGPLAKNKDCESKIFRCHNQQWAYCSCRNKCDEGYPQI